MISLLTRFLVFYALGSSIPVYSFNAKKNYAFKLLSSKKETNKLTILSKLYGNSIEASNIIIKNFEENIYNTTLTSKVSELFGTNNTTFENSPELTRQLLRSYSEDSAVIGATLLGVFLGYFWAQGGLLTMSICGLAGNSIASRNDSIGMIGRIAGGLVTTAFKELPKQNFPNLKNIFEQISRIGESTTEVDKRSTITVLEPKLNKLSTLESIKSTLQKSFSETYLTQDGISSVSETPPMKFISKQENKYQSVVPSNTFLGPSIDVVFTPSEKFLPRTAATAKTQEPVMVAVKTMIDELAKVTAELAASETALPLTTSVDTQSAPVEVSSTKGIITSQDDTVAVPEADVFQLFGMPTETAKDVPPPNELLLKEITTNQSQAGKVDSIDDTTIQENLSPSNTALDKVPESSVSNKLDESSVSVSASVAETLVFDTRSIVENALIAPLISESVAVNVMDEVSESSVSIAEKKVFSNVSTGLTEPPLDIVRYIVPVSFESEKVSNKEKLNPVPIPTPTPPLTTISSTTVSSDIKEIAKSKPNSQQVSTTTEKISVNARIREDFYKYFVRGVEKKVSTYSSSIVSSQPSPTTPPKIEEKKFEPPMVQNDIIQQFKSQAQPQVKPQAQPQLQLQIQQQVEQPAQPQSKQTEKTTKARSLDENLWSTWGKDIQWNNLRRGSDIYSELQRGGNFGGRVAKPAIRTFMRTDSATTTAPPSDHTVVESPRKQPKSISKEKSGPSPFSIVASLSLQLPLARGAASIREDEPVKQKNIDINPRTPTGSSEIKYLKRRGISTSTTRPISPSTNSGYFDLTKPKTDKNFEWFKAASRRIESSKNKSRIS